ncbi:MAG: hypothetical protein IJH07_00810 [Ruminococcus sp.]|nr:hypothetical protein [Ruminococcus sp.]
MTQSRNDRLAADYRDMLKLQERPYLSWIAVKGEPPCAEEYLLTVRIRTYALSVISGKYTVGVIDRCTIRITLWDSYPNVAPQIRMLGFPPVFHPGWYSKGVYCPCEPWRPETTLMEYVMRMLRTLQYDPALIDAQSPANYKALDWYLKNRDNPVWFPSDRTALTQNDAETVAAMEKAAFAFDEIIGIL